MTLRRHVLVVLNSLWRRRLLILLWWVLSICRLVLRIPSLGGRGSVRLLRVLRLLVLALRILCLSGLLGDGSGGGRCLCLALELVVVGGSGSTVADREATLAAALEEHDVGPHARRNEQQPWGGISNGNAGTYSCKLAYQTIAPIPAVAENWLRPALFNM